MTHSDRSPNFRIISRPPTADPFNKPEMSNEPPRREFRSHVEIPPRPLPAFRFAFTYFSSFCFIFILFSKSYVQSDTTFISFTSDNEAETHTTNYRHRTLPTVLEIKIFF